MTTTEARAVGPADHRAANDRLPASIGATLAIVAIVGGALGLVVRRILDLRGTTGEVELRPSDGLLLGLVLVALLVVAKLATQTRPPARFSLLPRPVRSLFRRLVELSFFGVGPVRSWTATNPEVDLSQLVQPADLDGPALDRLLDLDDETGAKGGEAAAGTASLDLRRDALRPPPPSHRSGRTRPAELVVSELREHVVGRGETFWSLAEQRLGDGKRWSELREVNLDREVAPGVLLGEDDILVSGWSILMPPVPVAAAPSEAPDA